MSTSNITLANPIYFGASAKLLSLARELRKNMTLAESLLWDKLKQRQIDGLKFRRQHPILDFIADFYWHERRLVIEVDGGYHRGREQKEYDRNRSSALKTHGITVLRFSNEEIEEDIGEVVREVLKWLKSTP